MSEAFTRVAQQLAEPPHLSELYSRGIHDFEFLEDADLGRFSALMDQLFRGYEKYIIIDRRASASPGVHGFEAVMRDLNGVSWRSGLVAFTLAWGNERGRQLR